MNKRRFITLIFVVILSVFSLSGCKKVVRTDVTIVEATVTETYHKEAWTQPVWTGKSMTVIYHPAQYKVTLKYQDYETTVNNPDLYNQYKDKIGENVSCNLVTTYYDDNTSKTKLEWEDNND